jgi:hypothetical protein
MAEVTTAARTLTPFGDPSGPYARSERFAAPRWHSCPPAPAIACCREMNYRANVFAPEDPRRQASCQRARWAAAKTSNRSIWFPISSAIARWDGSDLFRRGLAAHTSASRIRSAASQWRAYQPCSGGDGASVCRVHGGPQFTLAESNLYRSWGGHHRMTNLRKGSSREAGSATRPSPGHRLRLLASGTTGGRDHCNPTQNADAQQIAPAAVGFMSGRANVRRRRSR